MATLPTLAEIRKFLVTVTGLVTELIASGVLHGETQNIAQVVLGLLTAAAVYFVPNGKSTRVSASDSVNAVQNDTTDLVAPE